MAQIISEPIIREVNLELPTNGPIRRTAINESKIEYVELNANPMQGCAHACTYCYARKLDMRFGKVKTKAQWHNPKYYNNYFDILERELESGKIDDTKEIFLSTMTDLYQDYAIKYGIGRRMIELLQEYRMTYRVLTKSPRIVEDKDLFVDYDKGKVGLSITTDSSNEVMRKKWEPRTKSIQKRLDALKELSHENINLWVSAEPFLPGTNFENYFKEIHEYSGPGLKEVIIGKMNYEANVDGKFDWKKAVVVSEMYRKKYLEKVRYHYKKEYWNYLTKQGWNPVQLKLSPMSDFIKCHY